MPGDFSLPVTDIRSEGRFGAIKVKLNISGSSKISTMSDTLLLWETCRRNNVNEYDATEEMCEGDPYTMSEILKTDRQQWVTP